MDRPAVKGLPERSAQLGTFGGVFTPSVLTILGIILFRRLGFVVGSAGLAQALVMLGLATLITVLTSISLSAVATNRKVKGGGDYYLISRTLGVEFGGALGLILFAAQAISVAFYCVGFGEGISALVGGSALLTRLSAAGAAVVLFAVAYLGADLATRFQFVIMGTLIAALVSFFAGADASWSPSVLSESWGSSADGPGFWVIFAIFFPAVTGFTQGVSMSGDLKNPARSLPLGTFLAVGVSTVVYVAAMLALAGTVPTNELAADYESLRRVAVVPWLIDAGVLSATLSSALASFLGAPRILQALAADDLFKPLSFFAVRDGSTGNPRRGVILTAGIALVTIAVGDLDTEILGDAVESRPEFLAGAGHGFVARISQIDGAACAAGDDVDEVGRESDSADGGPHARSVTTRSDHLVQCDLNVGDRTTGVVAEFHGRRARVRALALDRQFAPMDGLDSGNDAQLHPSRVEDGSLFDVALDEGVGWLESRSCGSLKANALQFLLYADVVGIAKG